MFLVSYGLSCVNFMIISVIFYVSRFGCVKCESRCVGMKFDTLLLCNSGSWVWQSRSLRLGGLDTAILICWKLSMPLRVLLYIVRMIERSILLGLCFQWMKSVLLFLFFSVVGRVLSLSIRAAAVRRMGVIFEILWPRCIYRWMNNEVIWIKSSVFEFCCQ
jgi:hypothetical protein